MVYSQRDSSMLNFSHQYYWVFTINQQIYWWSYLGFRCLSPQWLVNRVTSHKGCKQQTLSNRTTKMATGIKKITTAAVVLTWIVRTGMKRCSLVQCEAPKIAKLVNITSITLVYGTYNELVTGAFVNQLTSQGGLTLYGKPPEGCRFLAYYLCGSQSQSSLIHLGRSNRIHENRRMPKTWGCLNSPEFQKVFNYDLRNLKKIRWDNH